MSRHHHRPRGPLAARLKLRLHLVAPVIVGVALLLPALATAAPASPGDQSTSEDMRGWVPGDPPPVSPGPRRGETALRHSPGLRRLRPRGWFLSGQGQHAGALRGKTIYLSPGHGWTYTSSAGWYSQRGKSQGLVEDMSNADGIRQFLLPYLWAAGAQIMPVRELDQQTAMLILDNGDGTTSPQHGHYTETGAASLFHDSSLAGFGHPTLPITGTVNPFALGGNRLIETAPTETARATFVLNVPRPGYYFVYVSYSMFKARPSDARYVVVHPGGRTTYLLDQRNHGSTWVLLGRHWFDAGMDSQKGAVIVSNQSADAGSWVSIDAVRIGGGEGIFDRGGGVSHQPRADECARYNTQFCGAPSSVYNNSTGNDRSDDISSRSLFADWLHADGEDAIYLSHHSNAFNSKARGTVTYIYGHNPPNGSYKPDPRVLALGADKLAKAIQNQVAADIRATVDPTWKDRGVETAYFGEINPSRQDEMPAALIELAFHDNAEDAAQLKDPRFRRLTARAIYKGIVKYFAQKDGSPVHIIPEPPRSLIARNAGTGKVTVSWEAPPTGGVLGDPATSYRVYFSRHGFAFDEGTDTGGQASWTLKNLTPGEVIFIRVTATNAGGESLPGPTLAVGVAQAGQRANLLLVGGFDRFDAGLDLLIDYTKFTQVHRLFVDRMNDGMLLATYGRALRAKGIAFDAAWRDAVGKGIDLKAYRAILWAAAKGATDAAGLGDSDIKALAGAAQAGVSLLVSGSTVAKSLAASSSSAATTLLGEHLAAALGTEGQTHTSVVFSETSGVLHGLGTLPLGDTSWRPFPVGPVDSIAATAQGEVTASYGTGGGAIVEGRSGHTCSLLATFPLAALGDDDRRAEAIAKIAAHCPIDGGGTTLDGGFQAQVDGGPSDAGSGDIPPAVINALRIDGVGDGDGGGDGGEGGCDCRVAGSHRRSCGKVGGELPTALILLGLFLVTRLSRHRRHRRPRRP